MLSPSMRVLVQRVTRAAVRIREPDGSTVTAGSIQLGFLLFVGFADTDGETQLRWMADKVLGLRLFPDADDKMNLSLGEVEGALLIVSQFTLYGDASKGRRPSFSDAARPEIAIPLYERWIAMLRNTGTRVETGVFGASMEVELVNDGPMTIWLDSAAS